MASIGCGHRMPENVIIEILSRLSVKSLMRFRCVCKYWYIVIKDSSFNTKHYDINNARVFVQHYDYDTERYAFALFSYEMPRVYHDLIQMVGYQETIIGPFDGILCLYDGKDRDHDRIALWNPATREFKSLSVPCPLPPSFRPFIHIFGFGLDVVTNKYKVVLIRHFWDEEKDDPYDPRVVTVYTLGVDSWRVFEAQLDRSIENSMCNTYLNGFYYWITSHNLHNYKVLSFDMSKETFREMPAPPDIPRSYWGDLALYIDSIAMILFEPREVEKYFDIWLMKEEGLWTKQLTIGPLLDIEKTVGLWKNGELFLERSTTAELVSYNHNTHEFTNFGPRGKNYCLKVAIYKESLFSVKVGNECQEGDNSSYLVTLQDFLSD